MKARRTVLACDGGIVVDGYIRTSEPSVVAAGNCAVRPHPVIARASCDWSPCRAPSPRHRGEQLLAVYAVNTPTDYPVVRKALTKGIALPAELAADASTPLKTLLVAGAPAR